MKPGILSTRKLSPSQRNLLLGAGMTLVERDFIKIRPLEFHTPTLAENIIFTSQNAVKAISEKGLAPSLMGRNIFCVGDKTAALVESLGLDVKRKTDYGADLAGIIAEQYREGCFLFFCGRKRRPDIPQTLRHNNIPLTEIEVYDTQLVPSTFERNFDGVLFFSPSAVQSFTTYNSLEGRLSFCIGTTTAREASRHGAKVEISLTPTIESVIARAAKYFRDGLPSKK